MILTSITQHPLFFIILWVVVFILAIVIELCTEQLVSIWFSGGALFAIVLAIFDVDWSIQLLVFVIISSILVAISRYIFFVKEKGESTLKTNIDMMVGERIMVLKKVSKDSYGEGKYRDVVWTLKSDEEIEANEYALIEKIEGNKLIVKKIK